MATITSFELSNFKGAEKVTIKLVQRVDCPVITLIGLNESGKTTILEGLSHFVTGDSAVSSLFDGVHTKATSTSLIPVHRKAAFTDQVRITAHVDLDADDRQAAAKLASDQKLKLEESSLPQSITVSRVYEFEDSVLKKTIPVWGGVTLMVAPSAARSEKSKRPKEYVRPDDRDADVWLKVVKYIENKLPRIAYFPTFLVDMPTKIYLKEHKGERPVNRYYRLVIQDVLDSLNEGLSLERHVCKRIEDFVEQEKSPNWLSLFFGSTSRAPIDSVFQKIANAVTREVLGSWHKVFQLPISAKTVSLEWQIDTEKENLPYASFHVSDGESRYAISERSLGFRWFFSFLLFTAFKQGKDRPTLFLFDEPAANLHAKAQAELLKSFSRIVSGGNKVIYSTHSHHMVNPHWLSGAYIVENTAVDYDAEDIVGLGVKPTDIRATNYRAFVGQHPNRTSYFQPVLEKLEYVAPSVLGTAPFLIFEGISDYNAFTLAKSDQKSLSKVSLMPGGGSGASGPLLSLLIGRGEQFIVLLDDDAAGKEAAQRYRENWNLSDRQVVTLGELMPRFRGKRLEGLLCPETEQLAQAAFQVSTKPNKKQLALYLAESVAVGRGASALGKQTQDDLREVIGAAMRHVHA
jgi:predicted ATPase